ncbi:Zinc finger protein 316 [Chionoecetes opilio]|uniref:Zinc finger protein 316 n=1 Tax=Chionoecetes opilio TaxID=41210 RepID=A0A8J4YJT3_CHIOP|nr:Zinc finger protein 316 [Chionoecetes opilio]
MELLYKIYFIATFPLFVFLTPGTFPESPSTVEPGVGGAPRAWVGGAITRRKVHKCSYCAYTTMYTTGLRRHLLTHTGERPFVCPHCPYRSISQYNLKRHTRVHEANVGPNSGSVRTRARGAAAGAGKSLGVVTAATATVKTHLCNYCPYTTINYTHLLRHTHTHTGEKPFSCPHCSYRATTKENLKRHVLTHTGEKPFTCPYCPYRASQKERMKEHVYTHTGEKPYGCNVCSYRCSQKGNLKSHMLTH